MVPTTTWSHVIMWDNVYYDNYLHTDNVLGLLCWVGKTSALWSYIVNEHTLYRDIVSYYHIASYYVLIFISIAWIHCNSLFKITNVADKEFISFPFNCMSKTLRYHSYLSAIFYLCGSNIGCLWYYCTAQNFSSRKPANLANPLKSTICILT